MRRTNITALPTARAVFNPTESTTFSAMNPAQTTVYTIGPLPRQFRPITTTVIIFPLGMPAGIFVSQVSVTGSALGGWTASYTLYNGTSSVITPTAQTVILYQLA